MKRNIIKTIAAASAVALAMVPAAFNAAGTATMTEATGEMGANNCDVTIANYEGQRPSVMIPKTITMTGVKECDYTLFAYAVVDESNEIHVDTPVTVTPDTSFVLTKNGSSETATATVTQDKKTFTVENIKNGTSATLKSTGGESVNVKKSDAKGHIAADITSGSWSGQLTFTIS